MALVLEYDVTSEKEFAVSSQLWYSENGQTNQDQIFRSEERKKKERRKQQKERKIEKKTTLCTLYDLTPSFRSRYIANDKLLSSRKRRKARLRSIAEKVHLTQDAQ